MAVSGSFIVLFLYVRGCPQRLEEGLCPLELAVKSLLTVGAQNMSSKCSYVPALCHLFSTSHGPFKVKRLYVLFCSLKEFSKNCYNLQNKRLYDAQKQEKGSFALKRWSVLQ